VAQVHWGRGCRGGGGVVDDDGKAKTAAALPVALVPL
jgi:hypothetical protein